MITFDVGNNEKHSVSFDYSVITGKVKILIDNKEYSSSTIMFVGHTPFSFQVGESEKHDVRIELDNPLGFAFRGSSVKAHVDNKLILQDHISGKAGLLLAIFFSFLFFVGTFAYLISR